MIDPVDFFQSLPVIRQLSIDSLVAQGVPGVALGNAGRTGDALKQINGRCASDGWFEPGDGPSHIAILAYDNCQPVDVVFWLPSTSETATYCNRAWALGAEQILNPGTYSFDQGLQIHSSVLNWLKGGRHGIYIIKPDWAFDELRVAPALTVEDRHHGNAIKALLRPKRLPKILVRKPMQEAA